MQKKHKNAAAAAKCENSAEIPLIEIPAKVKPKSENRPECRLSSGDHVAWLRCENGRPQGFPYKGGNGLFYPPKGTKCRS